MYQVNYGPADSFDRFASFGEALAAYRMRDAELAAKRSAGFRIVVAPTMINLDRYDYDTDGLTEDEREELGL